MIRCCAPLIGLALAGPAAALSCSGAASIEANYAFAAESEVDYVIAIGRLENVGPRETIDDQGSYRQMTRLEGEILIQDGFAPGWSAEVEVTGLCYGGGCGGHSVDVETLYFLERTDAGYAFVTGGCGGLAHANPTRADMDAVLQCVRGGCD
ncbi:hypothetical protein [Gymnodinialimonas hymeniacidonis]|uniref:hypothetical protein n=1 Tax=Gymnodinialimonas hymeniacidonis TaxID=3126508 RepID=UPI0034C67EF9